MRIPSGVRIAIAITATVMALLAGCRNEARPLTWEQLSNATYASKHYISGAVVLTDGEFVDVRQRVRIVLPPHLVAIGDLDGDNVPDAAVILAASTGGSGTFQTVNIVLNEDGQPEHAAIGFLGDRVKINSIEIVDGEVVLDMIVHGPADPMCCPTQGEVRRFRLGDKRLKPVDELRMNNGGQSPPKSES